MHVFDPRFAPSPHWQRQPPAAPVPAYRALQRRVGTTRTVIVNPSTYGVDNECTLDALAAMGPSARAVAVVAPDVAESALERMATLGVAGIRVNFVTPQSWGTTSLEMLETLARRVARYDWHVQVFMRSEQIVDGAGVLGRLAVPLVIDHLGRIPPASATAGPALAVVLRLLESGRVWVKLSGAYMDSQTGGPAYADIAPIARAYVDAAPDRLVWGSDWPHTTATAPVDDSALLDLLAQWAPDAELRHRILVRNPERLYGFAPQSA